MFMSNNYLFGFVSLSCITLSLYGCGGGGGGGSPASSLPTVPSAPSPYAPVMPINSNYPQSITVNNAGVWRTSGYNGNGVKVAVLDNGWNSSAELSNTTSASAQVYAQVGDAIVNTNSGITKNIYSDHGLYMSTIIGGQTFGIAPGASLINACISNATNGSTNYESIVGALNWAVSTQNADVVNLSFQGYGIAKLNTGFGSPALVANVNAGFNALVSQNRFMAIAAGNSNEDNSVKIASIESGGAYTHVFHDALMAKQVLMVGALNRDGSIASYTGTAGSDAAVQNRMIFAVGDIDVSSTLSVLGTSSSTAVVSGMAALMKQKWSYLGGKEISQIMIDTADRSFTGYNAATYGMGKLNAVAAFSPVGMTSVNLQSVSQTSYTPSSLSFSLPAGVQASTAIKYAAFDSYGRDFMYQTAFKNQPTTMIADAVAGFVGEKTVKTATGTITSSGSSNFTQNKITDSLSLQYASQNKGQSYFNGVSYMGFSNLASVAGLDSVYSSGFNSQLDWDSTFQTGLMYGEKQAIEGVRQSSGAYVGYKYKQFSVIANVLNNPQSMSGTSLLSADNSMLMSVDARLSNTGVFVGAKLDRLSGSGSGMLKDAVINTGTAYAGIQSQLLDNLHGGILLAYKATSGNVGLTLPYGRTDDGQVLTQTANIGLNGEDHIVSASIGANVLHDVELVTQMMVSDRDSGALLGVSKQFF